MSSGDPRGSITEGSIARALCPCGSSLTLSSCCLPLIDGRSDAPTAESLMRSRYTAYALLCSEYLIQSWHSTTRPSELSLPDSSVQEWVSLEVRSTQNGGERDQEGVVSYVATSRSSQGFSRLVETSYFTREAGAWRYLTGDYQIEHKIGRNEACPCGSGKKYKRCCG